MSGFYYLPEDRVREDELVRREQQQYYHKKGLKRNAGGRKTVLLRRLRTAIESRAPPSLQPRTVLLRQFKMMDKDRSGAVDFKEFSTVVGKYLNGVTRQEMQMMFRHYDKDSNGVISSEEFVDQILKEQGPHNFRPKVYKNVARRGAQADSRGNEDDKISVRSSRPRSDMSAWTSAVRGRAHGVQATTVPSSVASDARSLPQRDLRWAQREVERGMFGDVVPPPVDVQLQRAMLEEAVVRYLRRFRTRVAQHAGKELNGKGGLPIKTGLSAPSVVSSRSSRAPSSRSRGSRQTQQSRRSGTSSVASRAARVPRPEGETPKAQARNTLLWTFRQFAARSSSNRGGSRVSRRRFQAVLDVFRGTEGPVDTEIATALWHRCDDGDFARFVDNMVFCH